jgi:hypothetical protein
MQENIANKKEGNSDSSSQPKQTAFQIAVLVANSSENKVFILCY